MALWHQAHSDKCFFQLLIPGLTPVSLLESVSGFDFVTRLVDTGKHHLHVYSLRAYTPDPALVIAELAGPGVCWWSTEPCRMGTSYFPPPRVWQRRGRVQTSMTVRRPQGLAAVNLRHCLWSLFSYYHILVFSSFFSCSFFLFFLRTIFFVYDSWNCHLTLYKHLSLDSFQFLDQHLVPPLR